MEDTGKKLERVNQTLIHPKYNFLRANIDRKVVGENAGMRLDDDGGIAIHIAAEQPVGVPQENWLPLVRGDYSIDVIMRIYAPDLDRFESWTAPTAEMIE